MQNLPGGKVSLVYPKETATAKPIVPIPQK